ncbi:MAG: energy-coupling factor transporter transmembrane protein EcfT [Anaerolineae bacterium]|nr:energy-coupling factor transporter transmembrane protein EcfT [Anaerolineae bacterium]
MTRNPLYIGLIALSAWLTYTVVSEQASETARWRALLKLGLFIWALTIPFNVLMMHSGTHILFRLPKTWPLVGGNITLEAALYGCAAGFSLWTLLLVFAAFNTAVDVSQLLRFVPASLYQAGAVTSIALTFVPQMLASAQEIREAQQIRGHRFRGWRDALPLFVPLLTTSLERAIQLAESMESRGFGGELGSQPQPALARQRGSLLLGLALALSGLVARAYWSQRLYVGNLLILTAALLVGGALRAMGRHMQRSRYGRSHWTRSDTAVVLLSLAALAIPLCVRLGDKLALLYYPYPPYSMAPEFSAAIGLAIALLGLPALIQMARASSLEANPRANTIPRQEP